MTCGTCGAGTGDGIYLCPGDRDKLMDDLRDVKSTVEALWASAARMDVGAGSVGSSGHATPSEPTNARAYDTGRTLNVILTGWADALGTRQPHAVKAAAVLLAQIREVRSQVWAPDLQQELHDALTDCRRAMDRSAPRISLGACYECPGEVTAIEGETLGFCRLCGLARDVIEHQRHLIDAAWRAWDTLPAMLRALRHAGQANIPVARAEKWVERGKLAPVIPFVGMFTARSILDTYEQTPMGKKQKQVRELKAEKFTADSLAA